MASPGLTLSLTESQAFATLRAVLLGWCIPSDSTQPVEVVRGQYGANQVPEPTCPDFVIMSPLGQERLSTNGTSYEDNVVVGSIALTTLSVTAVENGALSPGLLLTDGSYPNLVAAGTAIVEQLTGPTGATGTYEVSVSQTLSGETLYAGSRDDLVPAEMTVQLDVHGPAAGDNARIIEGLWRSEVASQAFEANQPEGIVPFSIVPLYCEMRGEMPFWNEQSQVEYRWVIDAKIEIRPVISTPQQFATQLVATLLEVNANYPVE